MAHAAAYGLKLHGIIWTLAPRHGLGHSRRHRRVKAHGSFAASDTTNPQAKDNPLHLRLSASVTSMKTERGVNSLLRQVVQPIVGPISSKSSCSSSSLPSEPCRAEVQGFAMAAPSRFSSITSKQNKTTSHSA